MGCNGTKNGNYGYAKRVYLTTTNPHKPAWCCIVGLLSSFTTHSYDGIHQFHESIVGLLHRQDYAIIKFMGLLILVK